MDPQRLQHYLNIAAKKKILVLGDLMLDEFVWGNVVRISNVTAAASMYSAPCL
jgi:bifunctional ADP-heptose synthase (sugar kinase/adenylyltransferase)